MNVRRALVLIAAALFVVVGVGGAALFFFGGNPDADLSGLRGEVAWESKFRLDAAAIVTGDDDHVVVRSGPDGRGGVYVVAINLDTGEEVLRDRARGIGGGLQDGRVVYVQAETGTLISHDLGMGDRWEYSATDFLGATATPNGVVVTGPMADDVRVLDAATGEELWERVRVGLLVDFDANTLLVRSGTGLFAYDVESGDEIWQVPSSTGRALNRARPSAPTEVFIVAEETALVGYEPRSGDVLWEHPLDTGDSSFQFFLAAEENLVIECVAATTEFTVRTIDDRTGEVLATVNHDPQASLAGYNGTSLVIALGPPPSGCITRHYDVVAGPLEGYGLRDGDPRWNLPHEAVDLSQSASWVPDDRPGVGLRTDVIQWRDLDDDSLRYLFASTGEPVDVSTGNADADAVDRVAVDMVGGQIAVTTLTEATITVTLPALDLTVSGSNGTGGISTVYPVRGGLLVLAGQTLALVR